MPIRSISFYTYRTSGGGWTHSQIGVLRFVRAIKNQPLSNNGSSDVGYLLVNGVQPLRLLRQRNASDALDWFAEMAITSIRTELSTTRVALVPIPNSDCIQTVQVSRTKCLADAISKQVTVAAVADVLRWSEKIVPAHRGGPRDPLLLYPKLRLRPPDWKPSSRPHVLIDDVATSGGHIRAAASFLRSLGANMPLAISGAQAEQLFRGDPYQSRVVELPDFEMPG
jgi:hypothetical protein